MGVKEKVKEKGDKNMSLATRWSRPLSIPFEKSLL